MRLAEALKGVGSVFLDTAPVIYLLERHPIYFPRMEAFFRIRRETGMVIVTSPITLAECLVHPLRRNMGELAERYRRLIVAGAGTEFHEIGPEAAERAARLRAACSIPLTDALQAGVAAEAGCRALLTNDRRLSQITDVSVLVLDDLEV